MLFQVRVDAEGAERPARGGRGPVLELDRELVQRLLVKAGGVSDAVALAERQQHPLQRVAVVVLIVLADRLRAEQSRRYSRTSFGRAVDSWTSELAMLHISDENYHLNTLGSKPD